MHTSRRLRILALAGATALATGMGSPTESSATTQYQNASSVLDDGWTERQVRDALRRSNEKAELSDAQIDQMITRAYRDVLGRAPDASGLSTFRSQVKTKGWTDADIRTALRESDEYREKNTMTEAKAREIVTRAYQSVLGRDPDPAADIYVQKVWREKWTERDVANELRKSDEFRNKR